MISFQDPEEPDSWEGVRDATKPGNKCAQVNPYLPKKIVGSEDCLYLNVYTPKPPSKDSPKLPVIFYVHGGRLILGFGDYYRPDFFINRDVIFVSINYRLGIFGFLALDLPEAPGNAGLKDAGFALKWVSENIANFGGDENNITIMGESGGSGILTCFLTCSRTQNLFHKAIMESGSGLSDLFMEADHIDKAKECIRLLGKDMSDPREMYDYLMTLPVEELLDVLYVIESSREEINCFFLPVVEKKFDGIEPFLTEPPFISYKNNRFAKVPIIYGIHSHEGALFLPVNSELTINFKDEDGLTFYIPKYLFLDPKSETAKKMARELKRFYFGEKEIGMETLNEYVDLLTDAYFLRDIYMHMDFMGQSNNELYCYKFSYNGNMNTSIMKRLGIKGASHGDIVAYQFYRKNKADKMTEEDRKIVNFLSETWTNFAKHG